MSFRSRRMVLRVGEAEVQAFADQLGWPRVDEAVEEIGGLVSREVTWAAGTGLSLQYIEDPASLLRYLVVWGPAEDEVAALALMVERGVPVWSLDELLAAADGPEAVIRAGVGAPDSYDQRFFEYVVAAMTDPDTAVREAALYATAYSSYPQYREKLADVAQNDPDPARREDADLILESF
ncbi:hypothetical protein AB0E69_21385 [Kribbella sp. NPDC026611]|uniref:hypothetical protein n=1 Tax=Kribbella sp. NPDC026611 TaxID=3154911 RepID=UPI003405D49E